MNIARKSVTWALKIGCGVHFVHSNIYEFTETYGESMLPTLSVTGDFVHANKLYGCGKGVKVGDMIIAAKPTDPGQRVCKRITGMAGDVILLDPSAGDFKQYVQVPQGHVWVTGDNLTQSLDSRSYGFLPLGLIKGKVFAVNTHEGKFRWIENNLKDLNNVESVE